MPSCRVPPRPRRRRSGGTSSRAGRSENPRPANGDSEGSAGAAGGRRAGAVRQAAGGRPRPPAAPARRGPPEEGELEARGPDRRGCGRRVGARRRRRLGGACHRGRRRSGRGRGRRRQGPAQAWPDEAAASGGFARTSAEPEAGEPGRGDAAGARAARLALRAVGSRAGRGALPAPRGAGRRSGGPGMGEGSATALPPARPGPQTPRSGGAPATRRQSARLGRRKRRQERRSERRTAMWLRHYATADGSTERPSGWRAFPRPCPSPDSCLPGSVTDDPRACTDFPRQARTGISEAPSAFGMRRGRVFSVCSVCETLAPATRYEACSSPPADRHSAGRARRKQ